MTSINQILESYINQLDSIYYSLPIVMKSTIDATQLANDGVKIFLEKYGEEIDDDDGHKSFNLPIKFSKHINRKKKRVDHLKIALSQLPKNFLVSYVSAYDAFLGKLLRALYTLHPELLNSSERELQFKELIEFASINDAREYILEKEIESVLRKSHAEQFKYMENKFNILLTKDLKIWPEFIEITERRNLLVHNDGIVSNQYLKTCKLNNIQTEEKVNNIIQVNKHYLKNVYLCLYELGFKLAHVLWRKVLKDDLENADSNLIDTTYELLANKQYDLAKILLDFSLIILKSHHSDVNKRVLLINRALAYKLSGDHEKCKEVISKDDWSSCSITFKLAVAVLQENDEKVYKLMKTIGKDNQELPEHAYEEWPLFRAYRDKDEFLNAYQEIFGKDLEIIEKIEI
ncbi:hypothetical protein [Sulfurospirillum oryzae]|uniref:hypothetical protein n=1 Tax=Sulfurospirillum oryzae TaxID=2976535 RepID=UPI0021E97A9C|nr:hypothetical protein [Sulfurospirillum oryzae]